MSDPLRRRRGGLFGLHWRKVELIDLDDGRQAMRGRLVKVMKAAYITE
jgi:hypothetical protein